MAGQIAQTLLVRTIVHVRLASLEMGFIAPILTSASVLTLARPMQLAQTPMARTSAVAAKVTLGMAECVSMSMSVR